MELQTRPVSILLASYKYPIHVAVLIGAIKYTLDEQITTAVGSSSNADLCMRISYLAGVSVVS